MTKKNSIPARDNGVGETMQLDYVVQEHLSNCSGSIWMFEWKEVSKFGKSINHHQDNSGTNRLWQTLYKIH